VPSHGPVPPPRRDPWTGRAGLATSGPGDQRREGAGGAPGARIPPPRSTRS